MNLVKNEAGFYEVRYKDSSGKIRTKTTKQKNKDQARQFISKAKIAEMEMAAEMGILTPSVAAILVGGRKTTVEEALGPWREWREMKHHSPNSIADAETWVKAWATSEGVLNQPLMKITDKHLNRWVNSETCANKMGTRQVMLSALRSFFSFCSAKGWCLGDPSALVTVDPSILRHDQKEIYRQPIFTPDEVDHLLQATSEQGRRPSFFWHAAIAIGRYTGLRLGDIASLEWSCLAVTDRIVVWTQKRDRRVSIPIVPERFAQALAEVPKTDPEFLFPDQREIIRCPSRRALLSNQFGKLCRLCNIHGKSFHGLRATAATDLAVRGVSLEDIADLLGHSRVETTGGYIRPSA